jgi:NADH:ubiquinone reductase (H+-translocating)
MEPNVVIIGGGFGGLRAAQALRKAPVRVTLIDRSNHHLFQPLLYQVATANLSPADIASPIRSVLRNQRNAEVVMAEVTGIDQKARRVLMKDREVAYDYLIVATGSWHSYFGHDEWQKDAPGLKSIVDSTRIRRKILYAFEQAEMESDPVKKQAWLTFVLVGAGPTGVEMAGSIAELAFHALKRDFRHIDPASTRVLIIEAGKRVLASFPEKLALKAQAKLQTLGVEIWTQSRVEYVKGDCVRVSGREVHAQTIIWCAGVIASPAGKWLGTEVDRSGRVIVNEHLNLPGHREIFVIGDTACFIQDGKPLPGVAPVAMQEGRYAARAIQRLVQGEQLDTPFRYQNKGNLATIGRSFAVADLGTIQLSGFVAWVAWLVVHIYYLIGFRNRVVVIIQWFWAFITFQRGARLITMGSPD